MFNKKNTQLNHNLVKAKNLQHCKYLQKINIKKKNINELRPERDCDNLMQMKIMQTDEIYHFVYTFLQSSCCIVKPQIEPAPNELDHKLILFNLMP